MKVIDLLNMMNEGKKMPEKIIIGNMLFNYCEIRCTYIDSNGEKLKIVATSDVLNLPVKIVGFDKKQKELDIKNIEEFHIYGVCSSNEIEIKAKLNELIKVINQNNKRLEDHINGK